MEWTEAERAHLRLLGEWRRAMDLVGPGPLEPHFLDAAAAVEGLPAEGLWADLGSGAGFPGIALAARHPARVLLVESRQKRAAFLDQVVAAAGLSRAEVRCERAEALPDASLDGVIARAYRPPRQYLADAARLLRPGGLAVLMLGDTTLAAALDGAPLPPGWQEETYLSSRYAVPDGWRRRVALRWQG